MTPLAARAQTLATHVENSVQNQRTPAAYTLAVYGVAKNVGRIAASQAMRENVAALKVEVAPKHKVPKPRMTKARRRPTGRKRRWTPGLPRPRRSWRRTASRLLEPLPPTPVATATVPSVAVPPRPQRPPRSPRSTPHPRPLSPAARPPQRTNPLRFRGPGCRLHATRRRVRGARALRFLRLLPLSCSLPPNPNRKPHSHESRNQPTLHRLLHVRRRPPRRHRPGRPRRRPRPLRSPPRPPPTAIIAALGKPHHDAVDDVLHDALLNSPPVTAFQPARGHALSWLKGVARRTAVEHVKLGAFARYDRGAS